MNVKLPLFVRWLWSVIVNAWNDLNSDSQGCIVLVWFLFSVFDIILLVWVLGMWTREVGYGGYQLIYNVTMNLFWCTGLPLTIFTAYGVYKGVRWLWNAALKSYAEFKRTHS